MENEFTLSLKEEALRKLLYGRIDKSLLLSFLGGVFLGIVPFIFSGDWKLLGFLSVGISLILFFGARYFGLQFLFADENEKEEGEIVENNTGIRSNYNKPHMEIREAISPDGISLSLLIEDYPAFIEDLLSIKEGGEKRFIKYGPKREVIIRIVNMDGLSSNKKL